jgi:hypothetical protein
VLNHESATQRFPVASDFRIGPGVNDYAQNIAQQLPAASTAVNVGTANTGGFSWLVKILPYIEEKPLFDQIRKGTVQLKAGAFSPQAQITTIGTATGPHVSSAKITPFLCPSFAGDDEAGADVYTQQQYQSAAGNYCATVGTHLRTTNEVENNGAIQSATPINRGRGRRIGDLADGVSKTVLIAESKEEEFNSWYDGATTWVTALPLHSAVQCVDSNLDGVWDQYTPPTPDLGPVSALGYGPDPTDQTSLNRTYNPLIGRVWGPSSEHSGVVIHSYGDNHTQAITEEIDWGVYCAIITASGGESAVAD